MTEQYTTDETAVAEVLDRLYTAWAANDADAFASLFTEDATAILPGSYRDGRQGIRAAQAAGFAGPLKGSSATSKIRGIRSLGADAVLVVSDDSVLLAGESEVPAARVVTATWVLTKQDGQWLIASYHNAPREVAK